MDPITAIFNFLSTPAGQQIATQLIALDGVFVTMIGDFVKVVHSKNPPPATPAPTPIPPTS
jgi:hypothetical protein